MRQVLRQKLEDRQVVLNPAFLTDQRGMFSYTGFTKEQVKTFRTKFGTYTAQDGRINVAGLSEANLDATAKGFAVMRN